MRFYIRMERASALGAEKAGEARQGGVLAEETDGGKNRGATTR